MSEWSKVQHSKFCGELSVSSTKNPVTMRGHAVRKTEYFAVLSVSSFQKFWKRFSDRHMESCPSGRRCSTRNAVSRKASRVRIPNSPPKSPVNMRVCWTFLFFLSGESPLKSWKEQAVFRKELGGFLTFPSFEPIKSGSFAIARHSGPFAAEIARFGKRHSTHHRLRRGQL